MKQNQNTLRTPRLPLAARREWTGLFPHCWGVTAPQGKRGWFWPPHPPPNSERPLLSRPQWGGMRVGVGVG